MFLEQQRVSKVSDLPRHLQVQNILRALVESGRLKPGDKIPAELHIAEALGVSKMTVNKAILSLTSEGIFIREVGRGTFVAFSDPRPPAGRTRIVLSFPEEATDVLRSDYYGSLCRGVTEFLEHSGQEVRCDLSLVPLASRDYTVEEERDPAEGRLIIAPRMESIPSIEELWQRGKAVAVVGASWPGLQACTIDSDNVGGAQSAVQHLIGLRHHRIACLYAEIETANIRDRLTGYRRSLERSGLPCDPMLEVAAAHSWRLGATARRRLTDLLTGKNPVTAVFAAGHYLALEVKNVIRGVGLRIPEDVSVVGYDDPLAAQLIYPPLTTVRQPLVEMGRRAAEHLLNLALGKEEHILTHEIFPASLIVRGTTAPNRFLAPNHSIDSTDSIDSIDSIS